jgi:hypothetical protein
MTRTTVLDMRSGTRVRVKSATEIAATLDAQGRLGGIPFMPEMVAFAGRTLAVHRQADKTCVEGGGLRRLDGALLLQGARCDGSAHDGCQRGCLFFWKPEWLTDAEAPEPAVDLARETRAREQLLTAPTVRDGQYDCQSTVLIDASAPIGRLDLGHLATDVRRGDLSLGGLAAVATRTVVNLVRRRLGRPELGMLVGDGGGKPKGGLKLQPGEWVRVRPLDEIRATLGPDSKNNGLSFEPEMGRYAGRTFQVEGRVERIIHEETGRMVRLTGTVILKDLVCRGSCVKNCPRANLLYWREAWLERVEAPAEASTPRAA